MSRETTVRSRNEPFVTKPATRIMAEEPGSNPYLARHCRLHGYDLLDLTRQASFVDVLFLLFRGELPTAAEARLLERLLIAFINPGPRHAATRAAMDAGLGRTDPAHILPIGLLVLGGSRGGAGEVEPTMRALRRSMRRPPEQVAEQCLAAEGPEAPAPGFGRRYDDRDEYLNDLAAALREAHPEAAALAWGCRFVTALEPARSGWLPPGLAAAAFCDLGFTPRAGAGLYQLLCAPGLLAHGVEMANKPITALPFPDDEHYEFE